MSVRLEGPEDRAAALEVERLAFGSDVEPALIEALRDQEGSFALVAQDGVEIVGHVQLARAWVGESPVLSLGPIGVRPDRQGEGFGRRLVEGALAEGAARGEIAVILLGSPALYPRFGFDPASAYGLRNPFAGVQEDGFVVAEEDFMVAALDDRARSLTGEVRWHPAFGQTS